MKIIGYVAVIGLVVGAGLYFGGYVDGKADVKLTDSGRQMYNSSVQTVQEKVGALKVEAINKAQGELDKLKTQK